MKTKKLIALWTIGTVMLCSVPIGLAKVIPGVDEPFDPGNYYSPTSISWADSAPSPFALRDLARNGNQVIDYVRLEHSKKFTLNFGEILKVANDMLNANLMRMLGLEDSSKSKLDATLKDKFKETNRIASDGVIDENLFNTGGNWNKVRSAKEADRQRYLSNKYRDFVKTAQNGIESARQGSKNVTEALEEINKAEGMMQFLQADARLKALLNDAQNNEMIMRSALVNIRAIRSAAKLDRENADMDILRHIVISLPDPYNTQYLEKMREVYGQEKTVHSVFPDFK